MFLDPKQRFVEGRCLSPRADGWRTTVPGAFAIMADDKKKKNYAEKAQEKAEKKRAKDEAAAKKKAEKAEKKNAKKKGKGKKAEESDEMPLFADDGAPRDDDGDDPPPDEPPEDEEADDDDGIEVSRRIARRRRAGVGRARRVPWDRGGRLSRSRSCSCRACFVERRASAPLFSSFALTGP